MDGDEFNDDFLRPFLCKLQNDTQKSIYLAGDYNFDLLNASAHNCTSDFFEALTSNFLLPTITIPTKINSSHDRYIFTNQINPDIINGNLTARIIR